MDQPSRDLLQLQGVQKLFDVHGQPGDAVAIGGLSGFAVAPQVHSDDLICFRQRGNVVAKGLCALIPAVEHDQSLSGTLNLIVDGDPVICGKDCHVRIPPDSFLRSPDDLLLLFNKA